MKITITIINIDNFQPTATSSHVINDLKSSKSLMSSYNISKQLCEDLNHRDNKINPNDYFVVQISSSDLTKDHLKSIESELLFNYESKKLLI